MKNNLKVIIILAIAIVLLLFVNNKFSEHNLKKTISACVLAQKRTNKSFDHQKAKKYCEAEITKSMNK